MNKSMEIILTTLSPLLSLNYSSSTVSTSSLTSPSSSSSTSSLSLSQMNENISEINNNNNTNNTIIGKHFENFSDHLSHNYSLLISKLEKLAFDSVLSSTSTPDIENIFKNTPNSNNIEQQHLLQQKLYQQQEKHNFLNQIQYQTQQQLLKYSGGTGDNVRIINDVYGNNNNNYNLQSSSDIITEDTNVVHTMSDAEYSRFISDIWIGIVLTLLILSIVFFICSCFLYHKFQQWKNSYRSNNSEPEIVRRYDIDVESLPSYTLVSGLPTYDDAIEQFRKAGIIIQQPSVIKMFEDHLSAQTKIPLHGSGIILHDELSNNDTNNSSICIRNQNDNNNVSSTLNSNSFTGNNVANNNGVSNNNNNYCRNDTNISNNNDSNQQQFDNISLNSMCSCGNIMNNGNTNNMMMNISNSSSNVSNNNSNLTAMTNITDGGDTSSSSSIPQSSSAATLISNLTASVIELSPEQLRMLSQKRFSLQIALTNNNNNNPNNTNNNGNNNGYMNAITPTPRIRLSSLSITPARRGKVDLFREISRNNLLRSHDIPQIHHSTSSLNCCTNINNNERSFLAKRLMRNLQHRGSLS